MKEAVVVVGTGILFVLALILVTVIGNRKKRRRAKHRLPEEGTVHVHIKKGSPYDGFVGVVKHHDDGKTFMLIGTNSTLTNIRP